MSIIDSSIEWLKDEATGAPVGFKKKDGTEGGLVTSDFDRVTGGSIISTPESTLKLPAGVTDLTAGVVSGTATSSRAADAYAHCVKYIGDSEVFGLGPGSTTDLVGLTTIEPGYIAEGLGVGGETSPNMLIRFNALVAATPELLKRTWVFWTGRNNSGQGSQIVSDIQACVSQLGHSRYLVLTVTPRDDETIGTAPRISLIATNNLIKAAFVDHVVDLDPVVCTAAGSMVPLAYRPTGDILHFNALGYSVIYPAVFAKLSALPTGYEVTSPDSSLAFTSVVGASAGSVSTSSTIKLQGMNAVSPVYIIGGEYQINGGAWTSSPGSILNGDSIAVRHTNSASPSTTTTTKIFIGSSSAFYSSTTPAVSNLLTNGTFDDTSAWIVGAGVAISGGTLNFSAASYSSAQQNLPLVAGATYQVTYTITSRSAGSVAPRIFGATVAYGTIRSAPGTYTDTLVAPASPASFQFAGGGSADTYSIDNVTLVQL